METTTDTQKSHLDCFKTARRAAATLARAEAEKRLRFLHALSEALRLQADDILRANAQDLELASHNGASAARRDRMELNASRISHLIAAVQAIAAQPDPLAEVEEHGVRPSGIKVRRVRSPLGLIGMVFEARPNVTIDAAALAVYAGNGIILRPGREIRHSARALHNALRIALRKADLPSEVIQVVDDPDRSWFRSMLSAAGLIDLLIPRGGAELIRAVEREARVPVLAHATGVCHTYVDAEADPDMAIKIVLNAKTQRPGVCNATEGLLIDRQVVGALLPRLSHALRAAGVKLHASPELATLDESLAPDGDDYRGHEWLSLDLTVQAVEGVEGAIDYIASYGSGHTEAIVTNNPTTAEKFIKGVAASAVMVNASTRFNDGGELGLGAEIGISTSRLHAWGPMGALALTTQRWIVEGEGTVRQ